jgi:hypothetical protein
MKTVPLLALGSLLSLATFAAPVDRYNVVWDSPSKDHHGSTPLGNGDVDLNAWMTADGDLQFYISGPRECLSRGPARSWRRRSGRGSSQG